MKGLLVSALLLTSVTVVSAKDYKIDDSHTRIEFKVRHLGISSVAGQFNKFGGSFSYDPAKPEAAKAEAVVDVTSISTANTKRDEHLRSPDFFDTPKWAEMKFLSKKVEPIGDGKMKVTGDLTMRGVTKEVVLDAEFNGNATDPWGNERAAFTATGKINRKDFGLTWSKLTEAGGLVVGDEVQITLEVEGIATKG